MRRGAPARSRSAGPAALIAAWALAGCATTPADPLALGARNTALFTRWMEGTWTSAAQAKAKPDLYEPIRTTVARLPALTPDGAWLYLESAEARTPDAPYRQTVIHVTATPEGAVRTEQFRLKDPARARDPSRRLTLKIDDLIPLDGCGVTFKRDRDDARATFSGAMTPKACRNHYKGADWLDSRTELSADRLTTWDRGFKDDGSYVWGPKAGGYRFTRAG